MHVKHTCREKARKAGMGTRAAMKNAIMLLMDVRATLVPVRRKQSPVRSLKTKTSIQMTGDERRRGEGEEGRRGGGGEEERGHKGTLKGMLLPASVKE